MESASDAHMWARQVSVKRTLARKFALDRQQAETGAGGPPPGEQHGHDRQPDRQADPDAGSLERGEEAEPDRGAQPGDPVAEQVMSSIMATK
jgi:hypothetical protein